MIRPESTEHLRNIAAFNYMQPIMQPNNQAPNKIANNSHRESPDIIDKHYKKQQQFFSDKKEKEKKFRKSKKDKSKKSLIQEDRVRTTNHEPAPRNIPPKHDYQNVLEEQERILQMGSERKFGDTGKLCEKKTRCAIQDGVYVFHNSSIGSSLTSFAEIENHKKVNQEIDINESGKLKNFSLSKYLNIDVKSASPDIKNNSEKHEKCSSSKSSSLSNQSIDSMERNIILNGLKNSEDQTNSYLGPFNFRKLLKPTKITPTESLRKRKMVTSSPPPDKSLKTNGLF